jgi:AcrR family transcriptional regulator
VLVPRQPDEVPSALLAAVDDAVRAHGATALSLRDVARRAGVSHAAPGHFFGNKAGLLSAFAARGFLRLADVVGEEYLRSDPADGAEALAAIGRGYVRFAVSEPAKFEVMFRLDALDKDSAELKDASDLAFGLLIATIEQCCREGLTGSRDPMLVAVSAWSIVHGLACLWISGQLSERIETTSVDALAADVSELFVAEVLRPGRPSATEA